MSGPSEQAIRSGAEGMVKVRPSSDMQASRAVLDAAHDPALGLERSVCLRDVADWVADWVPEPARPFWRSAFIEKFGTEVSDNVRSYNTDYGAAK